MKDDHVMLIKLTSLPRCLGLGSWHIGAISVFDPVSRCNRQITLDNGPRSLVVPEIEIMELWVPSSLSLLKYVF